MQRCSLPAPPAARTPPWPAVTLHRVRAAADPDAAPRRVALPRAWDRDAADALAALAPGTGPISLPRAAEAWIAPLVARGLGRGLLDPAEAAALAADLRALLLARRASPGAAVWRGGATGAGTGARFVLNLPAFLDPGGGFDARAYGAAVMVGVRTLDALAGGGAARLRVGFADLAGLLDRLGLDYAAPAARAVGAAVAALTLGAAETASARLALRHGPRGPLTLLRPASPDATPVPGLAEAARAALAAAAGAPGLRHAGLVTLDPPDAAEALLGARTGGLSAGAGPADAAARAAMAAAVHPFLDAAPPTAAAPPGPARRLVLRAPPGPAARHAVVGGRALRLRARLGADGRLAGLDLAPARGTAAERALLAAAAAAVGTGLAHGAPLAAFAADPGDDGGPVLRVEGDPDIRLARSALDWACRRLARDHLGLALPDPLPGFLAVPDEADPPAHDRRAPLLPLDLPRAAPRSRRPARRLAG